MIFRSERAKKTVLDIIKWTLLGAAIWALALTCVFVLYMTYGSASFFVGFYIVCFILCSYFVGQIMRYLIKGTFSDD